MLLQNNCIFYYFITHLNYRHKIGYWDMRQDDGRLSSVYRIYSRGHSKWNESKPTRQNGIEGVNNGSRKYT